MIVFSFPFLNAIIIGDNFSEELKFFLAMTLLVVYVGFREVVTLYNKIWLITIILTLRTSRRGDTEGANNTGQLKHCQDGS